MKILENMLEENKEFLHKVGIMIEDESAKLTENKSKEILSYHPLTFGHMLRPMLVAMTAKTINTIEKKENELLNFASTIELLHNASLLHDDLLDAGEMRRNKMCLHKKYGFNQGLLAGNILYIKAISMVNACLKPMLTQDVLQVAVDMCEGEIVQADLENKLLSEAEYEKIIKYKTGSLMSLACRGGASIMEASKKEVEQFSKLGELLGVLYQLKDDKKDEDVNLAYQSITANCREKAIREMIEIKIQLEKKYDMKKFDGIINYFQ